MEVKVAQEWMTNSTNSSIGGSDSSSSSSSSRSFSSSSIGLPLLSLNHVSFVCKSLIKSVRFYEEVLGFVLIKRPSSFKFDGAWLFNYGIGIHLLECNSPSKLPEKNGVINPKDNHISFQCSDMRLVMRKLQEMNIQHVTAVVEEGGVKVDQVFFHDPDGNMVELCNCDNLPILPISSCPIGNGNVPYHDEDSYLCGEQQLNQRCTREAEAELMNNFLTNMMDLSF